MYLFKKCKKKVYASCLHLAHFIQNFTFFAFWLLFKVNFYSHRSLHIIKNFDFIWFGGNFEFCSSISNQKICMCTTINMQLNDTLTISDVIYIKLGSCLYDCIK